MTSTLSRMKVRRISISTCSVTPARTSKGDGLGVGKPFARALHDVATGRHVRKRHLSNRIGRCPRDDDITLDIAKLDLDGRDAQTFNRDRDRNASGPGRLLRRLRGDRDREQQTDDE